jgi:hypothetical protein
MKQCKYSDGDSPLQGDPECGMEVREENPYKTIYKA